MKHFTHSYHQQVVRHGQIEANTWRVFSSTALEPSQSLLPPDEDGWLVSVSLWRQHHKTLRRRKFPVGIVLRANDVPADLVHPPATQIDPSGIALITVDFPAHNDCRGYAFAQLLRGKYGWAGELRASGDVIVDSLHRLSCVGFTSFALNINQDCVIAVRALDRFAPRGCGTAIARSILRNAQSKQTGSTPTA